MNQTLVQLIGAKRHVLRILLSILNGGQHHVLLLIGRILKLCRLDRSAHPLLAIGVFRYCLLLTTQFVFTRAMLMLHPLVVLYGTHDGDGLRTKTELLVCQRVLSGSHCRTADQLTLQRGILLIGILHLHIGASCLVEHLLGLHSTTFVPPQQYGSQNKKQETATDCLK